MQVIELQAENFLRARSSRRVDSGKLTLALLQAREKALLFGNNDQ